MSFHVPGFQSSFSVFASFCIGQISHQAAKGLNQSMFAQGSADDRRCGT